ncbi:MAG: transglycosylase SLT domain-containing protein [bacterium]
MMKTKLVYMISLLLFVSASATAQARSDIQRSLQQQAQEIEPAIVEASIRYGIDARILRAICFTESRYRVNAVSPKGALGPMQFMPETAARYGLTNPFDPRAAIDTAARYLRDLLARFNGRIDLAVAAYNAGEGSVESFRSGKPLVLRTGKVINARGLVTGGIPPYPETQAYVRAIVLPLLNGRSAITSRALQLPNKTNSTMSVTTQKQLVKNSSFIEVQ